LPQPVLWVLTRSAFVPTVIYNVIFYSFFSRLHWYDRIDEHVYLGGVPFFWQFARLESLGVKSFVNLMAEFPHVCQGREPSRRGMTELHIPTTDYLEPRLTDLERAVHYIERNVQSDRITYVHCKAGKGRGPTVVLCYLMKKHRFSPLEALNYIVVRRPQISKHLHTRPSVLAYHAKLQASK